MRPARAGIAIAAMLARAAFASGCTSSSGQSSPGVKVKAPAFRADLATWNLPLDAYLVTDAQEGYAQALLYSASWAT